MRLVRLAATLGLLLVAPRADAAWHSVDQTAIVSGGGGNTAVFVRSAVGAVFSGTTATATLTSVVAGHLIMVMVCSNPNTSTLSGVTVGGNAATLFAGHTTNTYWCRGAFYPNSGSGSVAVVATLGGTCAGCNILAEEYSGMTTTAVLDGDAATYTADGTANTNLPSGSFTTTTNGDMIWSALFQPGGIAPTLNAGYTAGTATNPWWSQYLSPQVSAGATNPTFKSGTNAFDNYVVGGGIKP